MPNNITQDLSTTAFAFRGYNVANLGRTPELLAHPVYGSSVEKHLNRASKLYEATTGRATNLVERVRQGRESTPETYPEDLALIVAVELAQIDILREHFEVSISDAQLSVGYSLGEITALICSGVFDMNSALPPILALATDAQQLGEGVTMGILFSRGDALDIERVQAACVVVTQTGQGCIAISSILSPNSLLLLGQGETIDQIKAHLAACYPTRLHLKKDPHRWPPLHSTITRQRNLPNRAAVMLDTISGGLQAPVPPIVSCVTGEMSYNSFNSRELIARWIDQPQRLWDVVGQILSLGVETIVHVGPGPNIIPATMSRLSNNVESQMSDGSLTGLGLRAISKIVRRNRPWLAPLLSSSATLLRAPFVEQVLLEDWLLDNCPA
ncbi:MAG: ACP S-malonyltransferase [Planctomycetaceae bacterium]